MGEVFVVDSQATLNLVPPKQRVKGIYVLYTLLGLALLGVFVEGLLIYQLYQRISTQTPPENIQFSKQIGENKTQDLTCCKENPKPLSVKSDSDNKPAAFLHYNRSLRPDKLHLDQNGFPAFMNSFRYENGNLIIPKEGVYVLFSKMTFRNYTFIHEVKVNSSSYSYKPIRLMVDNRYSAVKQEKSHENRTRVSSTLVGVFKLSKNDHVFVSVGNQDILADGLEDFFGGFMI